MTACREISIGTPSRDTSREPLYIRTTDLLTPLVADYTPELLHDICVFSACLLILGDLVLDHLLETPDMEDMVMVGPVLAVEDEHTLKVDVKLEVASLLVHRLLT